jgi:hypothetical protein
MLSYRSNVSHYQVASLAGRLRPADAAEALAATGESPYDALRRSINSSAEVGCVLDDCRIIAAWGLTLHGPGTASPWMVASPEVALYPFQLVRVTRKRINLWSAQHTLLFNYVSESNSSIIPWLEAIGFTIGPIIPEFGVSKTPFYRFFRTTPCA